MYFEDEGDVFEVHYKDSDGRKHVATYYAESKKEAQKLFNSEKDRGDTVLFVKKVD